LISFALVAPTVELYILLCPRGQQSRGRTTFFDKFTQQFSKKCIEGFQKQKPSDNHEKNLFAPSYEF